MMQNVLEITTALMRDTQISPVSAHPKESIKTYNFVSLIKTGILKSSAISKNAEKISQLKWKLGRYNPLNQGWHE